MNQLTLKPNMHNTSPDVSVVVPVCNEAVIIQESIRQIVHKLHQIAGISWELLIVENGSRDHTLELAYQLADEFANIRVEHSKVANYGAALQQGLLAARGKVIVNYDIDYWDVEFLQIAMHVMEVKYDIVIASKNMLLSHDRRSLLRKTASYAFRMILFFIFGLRVTDTHGIKAWRNSPQMRKYFEISAPGHHTYDTEVIVRAMHDQAEVLEIPISVIETRTNDRHILKRVPQTLKELFHLYKRLP